MTMKRYNFSEIGGNNGQYDVLPAGSLVVDDNNNIRLHDGTTVGGNIVGGGNANTGNVVFDGNQLYVGGTGFLNLETDNGEAAIGTNGSDPLLVSINEGDKVWTFGTDGSLTFPDGTLQTTAYVGAGDANVWIETFESATPETDLPALATSVEYDADGNVIALFAHNNPQDNSSYTSVGKYTTTGAKLWAVRFASGVMNTDGWGLAVGDGSIYVAGRSGNNNDNTNISTLTKLSGIDGSIVWSKTYDFGNTSTSAVVDVAADGNPVMVGYVYDNTDSYVATTKVSATDGSVIWSRKLNGQSNEEAYGMAVGSGGEIVVTGYISQLNYGSNNAVATAVTVPATNTNWLNGTTVFTNGVSFKVDMAAGVPTITISYDETGNRTVGDTIATILGSALGGTDGVDDMIVNVASVSASGSMNDHMLVVKYDSTGSMQWQKAILFDAGYNCGGADADIDSMGNIYVTGQYQYDTGSGTDTALSILKLDSTGTKQWSRRVVGDCNTFGTSVVVGPDDKLYLSGMTGNNATSDFIWVAAKYTEEGLVEWQRLIDNTTGWTFTGGIFFAQGGGSNIAVKENYVALSGGFGTLFQGQQPHATLIQISAAGNTFALDDWDFKAASFSGLLNDTASDIGVVDAGLTDLDNSSTIDTSTITPLFDSSNFLIGTLYAAGYASGTNNIGDVTFTGVTIQGNGDVYGGGGLNLSPGPALTPNNQYFRVRGGDNETHLHLDTGDNSTYDQYFGDDGKYLKLDHTGNISIGTNSNEWIFNTDGKLTLPAGMDISQTIAWPLGAAIYEDTNLVLQSNNGVGIIAGNDIQLTTDGSGVTWTFDSNGNLTLPSNGDIKDSNGTSVLGGGAGLSPYVTINEDTKVEFTKDIVFASASVTASGYIISTEDPDGNEDSYFEASAADSTGVMYTVGYYYGDNDYALVYATNPDGTSKWRISIDQIDGYTIRPNTVICKNDFVFVGFKYYDDSQGTDRVGVVRLNADDGTIDTRWILTTSANNVWPSIRDVAINNNNEPIIVGQVDNEKAFVNNVTPLRGFGESGTDRLVVNTADILPSGSTNVDGIGWEVDSTGNGDWVYYSSVNYFTNIPVVSVQGSGTGMTVDFSYSGGHPINSPNMNNPGSGYTNNGNGDYTYGEELKIMGSSYGGVDGVNDLTLYVWTYNYGNNYVVVWPQQNGVNAGNTPTDKTYFNFNGGTDFRGVRNNNLFTAGSGFATNFTAGDISIVSDTAGGVWLKIDGSYPAITSLIEAGGSVTVGGTTTGGSGWSGGLLINTTPATIPNIGGTGYQLTYATGLADGRTVDTINVTDAAYTGTWNLRYSLNGQAYVWTPSWYHTYGAGSYERFASVAHDDNTGDIYIGGEFYQNSPARSDAVYKLDSDGNTVWAKYVEDSDSPAGGSFGTVALDSTGNYLFVISQNNNDASIVTKLNTSDGTTEWSVKQNNRDSDNYWNNEPRGAVDGDGNVYLTGSWTWDDNTYGLTIHKLNGSDGSLMWARKLNTAEDQSIYEFYNDDTQPFKVANGKIYYAGYTYDSNGNRSIGYALCVAADGSGAGTYGRWIYAVDTTFGYESCNVITDDGVFGATDGTEIGTDTNISLSRTPDNFGNLVNTTTSFAPPSGGAIEQVGSITFADGSVQTTASGGAITWTNPNDNVWRIEDYNGGAAVYYDGSDYDAKWFDVADSTGGNNNFRGAIIQYHAFFDNRGTVIGTIHLGNDYTQESATHTEHLSGNQNLQYATLWDCNGERGQLFFKMTNGNSQGVMIQWTAKIFYGSENNC